MLIHFSSNCIHILLNKNIVKEQIVGLVLFFYLHNQNCVYYGNFRFTLSKMVQAMNSTIIRKCKLDVTNKLTLS